LPVARVDAAAAQLGMTWEELLVVLVEQGLDRVEGPPRGRR